MWTYFIGMMALLVLAIVANYAWSNPENAKEGLKTFMGMPSWAFPTIGLVLGSVIYYLGLKIETDWPEAIGAFLIAGSVVSAEFMIGWSKFALGGLAVMPYVIPFAIFALLLVFGMVRSR
jgi:hypothetical protein